MRISLAPLKTSLAPFSRDRAHASPDFLAPLAPLDSNYIYIFGTLGPLEREEGQEGQGGQPLHTREGNP